MQHKTEDLNLHFTMIQMCVKFSIGFVATESNGVYYIEFTGAY